jgi:sporulation protein YlmC with PRC-barrel domain
MESIMKLSQILVLTGFVLIAPNVGQAQVAGSTLIGVEAAELRDVATGWSAKRQVLGAPIYNDQSERIGDVDDIIIAPDKAVSYAIINAGGFLHVTKHDVAVPVSQLKLVEGKLVLAGATRDALKDTPEFEYAQH